MSNDKSLLKRLNNLLDKLEAENSQLRSEIKVLEKKVSSLENRLKVYEGQIAQIAQSSPILGLPTFDVFFGSGNLGLRISLFWMIN